MKEYIERNKLITLITSAIKLNISNCEFMKVLYKGNKEVILTLNKSIRDSNKALEKVNKIVHIEILRDVYGSMVGQMHGYLMLGGTLICSTQLERFDKTEKGFKKYKLIQEENKKATEQKIKQRNEYIESVKKAKEQGKKVEMMYDPTTKSMRPVIMESKENNNA